jgi:pimeloyl-ACP methyl ester carboxylesterase
MTIYLAHATSFCAGVWRPVIEALGTDEVVAWDFAGHGQGPRLGFPVDWSTFGSQVLEETEPGGVGVGHSMGGTALVMAQIADPSRFTALVLVEPILFPGPHGRQEHSLSVIAEKRRREFDSRAEAKEFFATRPAFARWETGAIDGYIDGGLVGESPLTLACDPAIEADIYRSSNAHETWERLGEIEIPVLILSGESSDTIPPDLTRAQASQFPRAGIEIVPEAGHFLPMERPGLVAERVTRIWSALGAG